ncbi:Pkinase-domain-containing protein [Gonapodya prolifera JEL478]|uniref:Pkinase-domain-containing protein n=1 Tax=Gonapodya prolifera (strain JEL478) TaxID=1344416 RepID=A0A138ZYM7_GONPJ|nr:Pkinase-domain-containing protein [Gonapodya prolifera JEL478]|eukprot:KXS09612.1 Pkinase-domain-containing protein [Gonapodya prolifera JEL478]
MSNPPSQPSDAPANAPAAPSSSTPRPPVDLQSLFRWGKTLGKGSFAEVVLVKDAADESVEYAMKIINKKALKSPKDKDYLIREIQIMKEVDHPNCLKLHNVFESDTRVFLQLEYAQGGELLNLVTSSARYGISEAMCRAIVRSVASALLYLHAKGIVHRDLKLENIMLKHKVDYLDDDADDEDWRKSEILAERIGKEVKVGDFGLSNWIHGAKMLQTQVGSFAYMAPEVLTNKGYDTKCDMWSLGCVTYLLLSGFFPFGADDQVTMFRHIQSGKYVFPADIWSYVSLESRDFIYRLLVVDPTRRLSAEQALRHPWLAKERTPRPTMQRPRSLSHGTKSHHEEDSHSEEYEDARREQPSPRPPTPLTPQTQIVTPPEHVPPVQTTKPSFDSSVAPRQTTPPIHPFITHIQVPVQIPEEKVKPPPGTMGRTIQTVLPGQSAAAPPPPLTHISTDKQREHAQNVVKNIYNTVAAQRKYKHGIRDWWDIVNEKFARQTGESPEGAAQMVEHPKWQEILSDEEVGKQHPQLAPLQNIKRAFESGLNDFWTRSMGVPVRDSVSVHGKGEPSSASKARAPTPVAPALSPTLAALPSPNDRGRPPPMNLSAQEQTLSPMRPGPSKSPSPSPNTSVEQVHVKFAQEDGLKVPDGDGAGADADRGRNRRRRGSFGEVLMGFGVPSFFRKPRSISTGSKGSHDSKDASRGSLDATDEHIS